MTLDRTLKTHGGLSRVRSVLKRTERVGRLIDEGTFDPDSGDPLGLPKTKVRHSKAGTKTRKAEEKPLVTGGELPVEGAPAEAATAEKPAAGKGAEKVPAARTAQKAPGAKVPPGQAPAPKAAGGKPAGKERGQPPRPTPSSRRPG